MQGFETKFVTALKRIIILSFCIMLVSFSTQAKTFIEGTHYLFDKSRTATDKPEIVEYFSFSCPGCYAFEPSIVELLKSRPNTEFRRVHAPFGGRNAKASQKVFVMMKLLDAETHSDAIFHRIHKQKNYFDDDNEIIEFFVGLNFERSVIEQTLSSFSADTMTRKMNRNTIKFNIKTVPSLIVNGTYTINLSKVNSITELAELIDYLDTLIR